MLRHSVLAAPIFLALIAFAGVVHGQQISPNPNPFGNTIVITTGSDDHNAIAFQNDGDITIDTVIFDNEAGASLTNTSTGQIFVGPTSGFPGGIFKNKGSLNNSGLIQMQGGGGLDSHEVTSAITNNASGRIVISNINLLGFEGALSNRSTLINNGEIAIEGGILSNAVNGSISGSGELNVDGGHALIGTEFSVGSVTQDNVRVFSGLLEVGASGSVTADDFFSDDGVTSVKGNLSGDEIVFTGGAVLAGNGTVNSTVNDLSVDIDATIAPGEDEFVNDIFDVTGTLTIGGDMTLEGFYNATIVDSGDHDVIDATGAGQTVSLLATSTLEVLIFEEPNVGDEFDILIADNLVGGFGDIALTLLYIEEEEECNPEEEEECFEPSSFFVEEGEEFDLSILVDEIGSIDVLRLTYLGAAAVIPLPAGVWLFSMALAALGLTQRLSPRQVVATRS